MPLLTTEPKKIFIYFQSLNVSYSVLILVNPHPPYLTMDQFIFHRLIYLFDRCVGMGTSMQMWNRPHNKRLTMSKMPPTATSGKLAHAGKRKHSL